MNETLNKRGLVYEISQNTLYILWCKIPPKED